MREEKKSEIKVKLIVRGFDCSPEEITQLLNILPTKIWLQGEPVSARAKNVHKSNGWLLESPCNPVGSSLEEQVNSLFSLVTPQLRSFNKLPIQTNVELYCVLYVVDCREPVIQFSPDVITKLAQIGASIGIDIYDLKEL